MALDWPAFGAALWSVSDQLGIRPEWQLPVLSMETGGTFSPSITNSGGCVGLNQFCPGTYSHYVGVPVSTYQTWPASAQLSGPILAYWRDALKYGPIRSATHLMLAQLGQGLLARPAGLGDIVFASPSSAYASNSGFDSNRKGYITVQDIANAMAVQASRPAVKSALALAYAMRPNEPMSDPVYGDDYQTSPLVRPPTDTGGSPILVAFGVMAIAAGAALVAREGRRLA